MSCDVVPKRAEFFNLVLSTHRVTTFAGFRSYQTQPPHVRIVSFITSAVHGGRHFAETGNSRCHNNYYYYKRQERHSVSSADASSSTSKHNTLPFTNKPPTP